MATRRKYQDEMYYEPRNGGGAAWVMALAMVGAAIAFVLWLSPDILPSEKPAAPAPSGAVGNQAPPSAIRRAPAAPAVAATPIPGVAQNEATSQAQYDAAVQQQEQAAPTPVPLPLNSAGQPVISEAQQAQQAQSLVLAEQEGGQAADAQLAAQRATAYADQAQRPPDVSKADAEQMMHRDLCSVPRADPHTCGQGLYKPTPVN